MSTGSGVRVQPDNLTGVFHRTLKARTKVYCCPCKSKPKYHSVVRLQEHRSGNWLEFLMRFHWLFFCCLGAKTYCWIWDGNSFKDVAQTFSSFVYCVLTLLINK